MTSVAAALHELRSTATAEGPFGLYEHVRQHGPVARKDDRTWVVTGFQECNEVLRSKSFGVPRLHGQSEPGLRGRGASLAAFAASMLFSNEAPHDRMRSVVSFCFTPVQVELLTETIERVADSLLEEMAADLRAGVPVDLVDRFAARLPMAVVAAMMGFDREDEQWFRQVATQIAIATDGVADAADLAVADQAMSSLTDYFEGVLAADQADPGGALLTVMREAFEAGTLERRELLGNLMLLLTAGFETTSFLISASVLQAVQDGLGAALAADPALLDGFVGEALRFHPPVHLTTRECLQDTTAFGATLHRGDRLVLLLAAANRDPRRFDRPSVFDPARDAVSISFGAGKHFCLGASLARLECRVAVRTLFDRYPDLQLSEVPRWRRRLVVRGLEDLPVELCHTRQAATLAG